MVATIKTPVKYIASYLETVNRAQITNCVTLDLIHVTTLQQVRSNFVILQIHVHQVAFIHILGNYNLSFQQ